MRLSPGLPSATTATSPPAAELRPEHLNKWVLHRLWIAAGNQALAHAQAAGAPVRADRTWADLYGLRNHLAHSRLPHIGESLVRRFTWTASTPSVSRWTACRCGG
jgi:hypothetical protein